MLCHSVKRKGATVGGNAQRNEGDWEGRGVGRKSGGEGC